MVSNDTFRESDLRNKVHKVFTNFYDLHEHVFVTIRCPTTSLEKKQNLIRGLAPLLKDSMSKILYPYFLQPGGKQLILKVLLLVENEMQLLFDVSDGEQ